jgi:acetolactate synthase I/II/III large subunit
MNGAESLVRTLVASGVDLCFANPGTSEMHFIDALGRVGGMRAVLGLFEGVVTGAADGFFRVADKPAATLLHLAPGFGNGIANLHNARKAESGIVNIVGQHATTHLHYDAPLSADLEGVARPMSHWLRMSRRSADVARDAAEAVRVASGVPGRIATLLLPADTSWGPATEVAKAMPADAPRQPDFDVEQVIKALCSGPDAVLLLGGRALRGKALEQAGRVATRTGCRLMCEGQNARLERGAGRVSLERLSYDVDGAIAALKDVRQLVLVGAKLPIAFFAYPDRPSELAPQECTITTLASGSDDVSMALDVLVDALGADRLAPQGIAELAPSRILAGSFTLDGIGAALGTLIPENAIVVDESISSGRGFFPLTAHARPHDWMNSMGASLGYALPVSIGAALAAPDRKVIALVGDGSAMYTPQALWTMAREHLDVTVIIFANRSYNILHSEMKKIGVVDPGEAVTDMFSLDHPALDWPAIAKGHGVPGVCATDLNQFMGQLSEALSHSGPSLIELVLH